MKGQFFVIATVIMIYTLMTLIQYIYDFSDINLVQLKKMYETNYIQYIKDVLNETAASSIPYQDCSKLEYDINSTESFLKNALISRGIDLTINHQINCPSSVDFSFSLKTPELVTITGSSYFYVPAGPSIEKTITLNETNGGNVGDSGVVSFDPDYCFGSEWNMDVNYDVGVNDIEYSFLLWDLSVIPAGSLITKANMSVFLSYASSNNNVHYAYNTSNNWNEANITYNKMPSLGKLQSSINSGTTDGVWKYWDVTNAAIHQFAQTNKNMSIRLSQTVAATYAVPTYTSKDYGDAQYSPQLVITYTVPSGTIVETRWFNTLITTVNNLFAYELSTTASSIENTDNILTWTSSVQVWWGIRVWKRSAAGVETEITTGTPVATVTRTSSGTGLQSGTWDCPQTALATTDSIVVRVYGRGGASSWIQFPDDWMYVGETVFTTEQLGSTKLDASTWTVTYWTGRDIVSSNTWQQWDFGYPPANIYTKIDNFKHSY